MTWFYCEIQVNSYLQIIFLKMKWQKWTMIVLKQFLLDIIFFFIVFFLTFLVEYPRQYFCIGMTSLAQIEALNRSEGEGQESPLPPPPPPHAPDSLPPPPLPQDLVSPPQVVEQTPPPPPALSVPPHPVPGSAEQKGNRESGDSLPPPPPPQVVVIQGKIWHWWIPLVWLYLDFISVSFILECSCTVLGCRVTFSLLQWVCMFIIYILSFSTVLLNSLISDEWIPWRWEAEGANIWNDSCRPSRVTGAKGAKLRIRSPTCRYLSWHMFRYWTSA